MTVLYRDNLGQIDQLFESSWFCPNEMKTGFLHNIYQNSELLQTDIPRDFTPSSQF